MIYGLIFATLLTLLLIPSMYLIAERLKRKSIILFKAYELPSILMYVPFFFIILNLIAKITRKKIEYGDLDY